MLICLLTTANGALADSCKQLTVNGNPNWQPFFSHSSTDSKGIIGDVVFEAAKRQNIELRLAPRVPWKRLLFELKNGKLDIIAGALKTEEREKVFDFSTPVYHTQLNIYVHNQSSFRYTQPSDLKDKLGLIVRGMSLGESFDGYALENLVIRSTTNTESLFKMVNAHRVDYGIFYLHSGLRELKRLRLDHNIRPLFPEISKEPIHVAFSRKSKCSAAIARLAEELTQMKQDGTLEKIISTYISSDLLTGEKI